MLIVVCDGDRERVQSIARVAAVAGATVVPIDDVATVETLVVASTPCIGLVRIVDAAGDAGLAAIRALTKKGLQVVAYGERLDAWPIGVRCRALLAGATTLIDSAIARFADHVWARVASLWAAEARLARDQEEVRLAFRKLGIVGQSEAMQQLFRWTVRISRLSDLHTLITGETGTGKQLFAEAIHRLDPKRRNGPFVVVNCGAISAGLAESELFGHRRGAFTGAERERKGLIRAADGGVLLLDEIGEMDLALQAKVLRVLQEGRVLSLGDDHEVPVDVRVIAATNRNLEEMVLRRTFRADLFHRLNVLSVHIPPLRDRLDDLDALVTHFVAKHGSLGSGRLLQAGPDFVAALAQAELLGNAREVENLVRHAIVRHDDESSLTLSDLPPEVWSRISELESSARASLSLDAGLRSAAQTGATDGSAYLWQTLSANGWNLSRSLASCERTLVESALRSANGNQARAAKLLGLTPRSIYNKRRKYHLPARSA